MNEVTPRTTTGLQNPSSKWRPTAVCLIIGLVAFGGSAHAAEESSVVPHGGKVAGEGYAYWLQQKERVFFNSGGSPKVCGTLHAPGGTVAFLTGGGTCDEPAGRPIYVDGVANECSTFRGDHNSFGTSPTQLKRCARAGFKGLSGTAKVDGVPVVNYPSLIAAANAVAVHIPRKNTFGAKPGNGMSAGYGEGLLLHGLAVGTQVIQITSSTPSGKDTAKYTLHIQ